MVNLSKGQKVDLTKGGNGVNEYVVGLGWDTNQYDGTADFDLDTSVFCVGANGKVTNQADFIFYNNLEHTSGGVRHLGDNLTGEGDGDDEQIEVNLNKLPANIERVVFTVTINDAIQRNQNFGQVNNAYIRVVDKSTNAEVLRFDLTEDFSIETALVVGELYRHNGEWKFNAIGSGYQGGLEALCRAYGLDVG